MKTIDTNELKTIQLKILDKVDDFCQANGINYFLTYGTLIGAVRHKGYIPWDDDIDIGMLREDYDKFVATFNGFHEDYTLHSSEGEKWYPLPFAKVGFNKSVLQEENEMLKQNIGVNIDVFPFDRLPSNKLRAKIVRLKAKLLRNMITLKGMVPNKDRTLTKRILLRVLKFVLLPFSGSALVGMQIRNATACKEKSNSVAPLVWEWWQTNDIETEKLEPCKMVFEGKEYLAPVGYDQWLRGKYGDYMQLPPEEKRVSHHRFTAYYK